MGSGASLWCQAIKVARELRPAFSRERTFLWFLVAMMGFMIRTDLWGVTSFVRVLGLKECFYYSLLRFFRSNAVDPDVLARRWTVMVLKWPGIQKLNGRVLLVADGVKAAKSGRKMPAVKRLHQQSESNTKPEYISGHSCQSVGVLMGINHSMFCVPLISRIHEGLRFTNRDRRTQLDKLVQMVQGLKLDTPFLMIADTYYASGKIIKPFFSAGNHLLCPVKKTAVAFMKPVQITGKRKRGKPIKYGNKVGLASFFDSPEMMLEVDSPYEDEKNVRIKYRSIDLFWKPAGMIVRFVVTIHPGRGKLILMCTDLELSAEEMIRTYGCRFKIEVSFKQAIRNIGAYAYHFWCSKMKKRNRFAGDMHMHRATRECRDAVKQTRDAYHRYIQTALIAQGIMMYLACNHTALVRQSFGSWFRTVRAEKYPSETMVAKALLHSLPEYLVAPLDDRNLVKFLLNKIDYERAEGKRLVA